MFQNFYFFDIENQDEHFSAQLISIYLKLCADLVTIVTEAIAFALVVTKRLVRGVLHVKRSIDLF